jgi:uncharacterized sulfatase
MIRYFLIACACAVSAAASWAVGAEAARPNIVFIISDDHRWDALGAAGNKAIHTPNLDRLAKQGTYFRQGTVFIPQCSPVRASLITGLPPHENGHYSNQSRRKDIVDPDGLRQYPTLPGLLKSAGYRTVLVGKWHLSAEPWNSGFSDIRIWLPGGSGKYRDNSQLARGNARESANIPGYVNEVFGKDAAAFISSDAAKEKPFLLWLALTAPHTPLTPNPEEIQKLYEGKSDKELWPPSLPKQAEPRRLKDYYEAVTMADRQVGHVLTALEKQELMANTIVVFMGDNGWLMGSRDLNRQKTYQGKVYPYDDSIRVPFLMHVPGKNMGTSDACVSSMDLPPTFLKAAGVSAPANWPGREMLALLSGDAEGFDHAVCEFPDSKNSKFGDVNYRLIRTPTHKLIDWADPQRADEFYDLASDPEEKKNLIDAPDAQTKRQALRGKLVDWMKKTDDPALQWSNK